MPKVVDLIYLQTIFKQPQKILSFRNQFSTKPWYVNACASSCANVKPCAPYLKTAGKSTLKTVHIIHTGLPGNLFYTIRSSNLLFPMYSSLLPMYIWDAYLISVDIIHFLNDLPVEWPSQNRVRNNNRVCKNKIKGVNNRRRQKKLWSIPGGPRLVQVFRPLLRAVRKLYRIKKINVVLEYGLVCKVITVKRGARLCSVRQVIPRRPPDTDGHVVA